MDIYMQVVQIVQIYYATLSYTKPHEVKPRHIMSRVMTKRPIGLAKGTFEVPTSFFEELPEEITALFSGITP